MHEALSRALYRSLLRTSKFYTSGKNVKEGGGYHASVLCSLLYRSGSDDYIDYSELKPPVSSISISTPEPKSDRIRLTPDEARDLTKSYAELQKIHEDGNSILEDDSTPQHIVLYKRLLREVLGPKAYMNFPYKCTPKKEKSVYNTNENVHGDDDGNIYNENETTVADRLQIILRREFEPITEEKSLNSTSSSSFIQLPLSWSYTDANRRDAAFIALRELKKKLIWYETMIGMDKYDDDGGGGSKITKRKKDIERNIRMNIPPARGVIPLSTNSPSNYLRSGTYLVAHPLLSGCFAKSVICILEHTEPKHNDSDNDGDDPDRDRYSFSSTSEIGGTYGLMINKPIRVGVPNYDSKQTRDRMLRETIRHDCLPKGVKRAFGDCPVRNGGPVNLSVQMLMLRTTGKAVGAGTGIGTDAGVGGGMDASTDVNIDVGEVDEDKWGSIGGSVLPMVVEGTRITDRMERSLAGSETGTGNGSLDDNMKAEQDQIQVESCTSAMDSDSAVHYGGDIIQAAQAVIDGDIERDTFSFVVGASCWETGQLENEIERGYWLPCTGPPQIAHSGTCETAHGGSDGDGDVKVVSERDLWVAMMSALGRGEAELAHVMRDVTLVDDNAFPCDHKV